MPMNRFSLLTLVFAVCLLWTTAASADDANDRFSAALRAFQQRQYDVSKSGFSDFVARYPSHIHTSAAKYYLAESLLYLKDYVNAERYYRELAGLDLDTNEQARIAYFRLADIPYIQGQYSIAKPRLEAFVERLPHDKCLQYVLYYLGDIAMQADKPLEAEHYFNQSVSMFPQGDHYVESEIGLAWAKNQLGKQTEADAIFDRMMRNSDPAVAEPATYQYGVALFERGDYRGAATLLTQFQTKYGPQSGYYTDSQRVLARCLGSQLDFEGALRIIEQIRNPTIDDTLMRVRCLYGTKQMDQAQSLLKSVEYSAGPAYRDELALLNSVFSMHQNDWNGAIGLLESFLRPTYTTQTGQIRFNYLLTTDQSLNDEGYFKACSLLAIAYARNGQMDKAQATINEMRGNATTIGNSSATLTAIVTETSKYLEKIANDPTYRPGGNGGDQWAGGNRPGTGNRPGDNGQWNGGNNNNGNSQWGTGNNRPGSGSQWGAGNNNNGTGDQWGGTGTSGGNRPSQGTDVNRFWQALQLYEQGRYADAVSQFDQLLQVRYDQWTKLAQINYTATNRDGALNETSLVKAASTLALARARLGQFEQANAVLTAFLPKVQWNDNEQQSILRETQGLLLEWAKNGSGTTTPGTTPPGPGTLLGDSEAKKLLRESNTLYRSERYREANDKLASLIAANPGETHLTEALMLRGKTLLALGRDNEAVELLEKIVDDYPTAKEYPDALWGLGLYYDDCGDTYSSIPYFQTLADKFRSHPSANGALYFLAVDDLDNGNGRKADTYLKQVFRNYETGEYWSHATLLLAYEAYKKRDYHQAEMYVQKLLQHPPDYAILDHVLYLKGDLALRNKEYETAFVAFREIGNLCPESSFYDDARRKAQTAGRFLTGVK